MAKSTKSKVTYYTTPPLVASMVFLNEPSTKFKKEGEYSTKLTGTAEDFAELIEQADKAIEIKLAQVIKENPKLKKLVKPVKPYKPEYDDEGDETGKLVVNFKRAAKQEWEGKVKTNTVKLLDTDGKVVTDPIWSGSTLMARYFMTPYFSPKDNEVGVSCKITHAVVVDLVSAGGNDGDEDVSKLGFGKVNGYKASGSKAAGDDEAGEDADTAEDDEDGDF